MRTGVAGIISGYLICGYLQGYLTPVEDLGAGEASVLHHAGHLLSRCGCVLQVGVVLEVEVPVIQLLGGDV